jgi:4-hydroxy-2-oxoheptanedioate aldolase
MTDTPHWPFAPNPVRERRLRGEIAFNAWTYLTDPAVVEIAALAGFDAVTFDLEHFPLDMDFLRQAVITANAAGISPFVRVPSADSAAILPLLDIGVQGILVPQVDEDAARAAVRAVRFAPVGERGALGFSRAAGYGEIPWNEHAQRANDEVTLLVGIESWQTVERAAEIAAIDGVDFVTIGAHDLSESMGVREGNDPTVRAAILGAAAKVRDGGKARLALSYGNDAFSLTIEQARELGVGFLTVLPSLERQLLTVLKTSIAELRARATPNGA